ncbi:DUF6188 family protein [Streptomyces canus]|uniref:DUF6188 family protein n=1 Tax=Streptomyces canus TaxID=58343 RepID=UPI003714F10B
MGLIRFRWGGRHEPEPSGSSSYPCLLRWGSHGPDERGLRAARRNQGGSSGVVRDHVAFDPESPHAAASYLVRLARDVITRAEAGENGDFVIEFESGMKLTVRPDEDYEAWGLVGPKGRRVTCMPGGEIAVWGEECYSAVAGNPDPASHLLVQARANLWIARLGRGAG